MWWGNDQRWKTVDKFITWRGERWAEYRTEWATLYGYKCFIKNFTRFNSTWLWIREHFNGIASLAFLLSISESTFVHQHILISYTIFCFICIVSHKLHSNPTLGSTFSYLPMYFLHDQKMFTVPSDTFFICETRENKSGWARWNGVREKTNGYWK